MESNRGLRRPRNQLLIAAQREIVLTYGELGKAIGLQGVAIRNQIGRVLDAVSDECERRLEPSLAALVVRKDSGKPGPGWEEGGDPWHKEQRKVFDRWSR